MIDTRQKILTPEQARASLRGAKVFLAYFDVVTAELVRHLRQLGHPVVALVLDPPHPVLPARTRAELAAALACVEAVIPLSGDPTAFLQALEPDKIIHWEHEDASRTSKLIEHVQSLQNA